MQSHAHHAAALAFVGLLLFGCGRDAAPPEPGEGAVGTVAQPNAGAAVNPIAPPLSGGPAGQTPAYGEPGGAPSIVRSEPGAAPPASSGDPTSAP